MKLVFGLIFLVLSLPLISESFSYFDADIINHHLDNKNNNFNDSESEIIQFNEFPNEQQVKRYLIFGKGSLSEINSFVQTPYSISSSNGFFSIIAIPENTLSIFQSKGFHIIEDFQLDFHSKYVTKNNVSQISTIGNIANSERVHNLYNVTGNDVTIAIIDTGVDFSNPDMQHALARDNKNFPIMLDPDGQGLILTNATFAANIDQYGTIKNFTKSSLHNTTSDIYVKPRGGGVFLNIEQNGDGTRCPQISIDPYLQNGIQNKLVKEFNQTEPTISISPQDGNFEVQIQTTKSAGIVLGVTLRSTSEFQVVAWRDLELGEEL